MYDFALNKFFLFLFLNELLIICYKLSNLILVYDFFLAINLLNKIIFLGITIILIRHRLDFIRVYLCFFSSLSNLFLYCSLKLYFNYKSNIFDLLGDFYYVFVFLLLSKIEPDNEIILPIVNVYKKEINGECIICFSDNTKIIELLCKHAFHKECIEIWFHTSRTCPICRIKY
jgi:hypothetical protein